MNESSNIKNEWKKSFSNKRFLINFIISFFALASLFLMLSQFLQFNEYRVGAVLNDPLLNIFKPIDLNVEIFVVLYLSVILAIINIIKSPSETVIMFIAYGIMIAMRMTSMYFVQLNPPNSMIELHDPIILTFASGKMINKDLFFSGHTATMCLMYYSVKNKKLKLFLLIGTIFVGLGVLIQHVHYSIDVIAAPFASYLSYRFAQWIYKSIS